MATLTVPAGYGLCIVSNVFGTFAMGTFLGSKVMKARDEYDVQYPNLYATPGFHKQADAFNRVQRGHQSMFESVAPTILASLVGGLRYPYLCAAFTAIYNIGCYLYQAGYADTKQDVKVARHLKGGPIRYVGILGNIVCAILVAGSIDGWW